MHPKAVVYVQMSRQQEGPYAPYARHESQTFQPAGVKQVQASLQMPSVTSQQQLVR